jgi:hypothetical protein
MEENGSWELSHCKVPEGESFGKYATRRKHVRTQRFRRITGIKHKGNQEHKHRGKMGPIHCPKTSVKDYHSTLHNIPEERRSHQHCGRSLKSRMRWLDVHQVAS